MEESDYLDSLSSPRFSSSSSLPLYSYSVSSGREQSSEKTLQIIFNVLQFNIFTLFSSFLARPIDMVFELDADLPLSGLVSDEGVLEQLLGGRSAGIRLHKAALDEVNKFLGPGTIEGRMIYTS